MVESSYHCCVRATELVRSFREALRLIQKLDTEAKSEAPIATGAALRDTLLNKIVLFSANELSLLLCTKITAAHARRQKQIEISNGLAFCVHAVSLHQKMGGIHSTSSEKRPLSSDDFLLIQIPQKKTSSQPLEKMYLSVVRDFSYEPTKKQRNSPARTKARARRAVRAAKDHPSLWWWVFRRGERKRVLRLPSRETPASLKIVLAPGPVGLILSWILQPLRTRADPLASLIKATES